MSVIIREFQLSDADPVSQMEQHIFSCPWSKKAFEELLTRDYCLYLVAENAGKVIGFAGMTISCGEADIDKVMVEEASRGRHLAERLLEQLFARGEARGVEAYTLEVRVGNEPAIGLYRKLGFESAGVRPGFYEKPTEDALIMWKR